METLTKLVESAKFEQVDQINETLTTKVSKANYELERVNMLLNDYNPEYAKEALKDAIKMLKEIELEL